MTRTALDSNAIDDDISIWDTDLTCLKCGWQGTGLGVDRVPDPGGPNVWKVCPRCRCPENFDERLK